MMKPKTRESQSFPLDIVGSTVFGRYPKISSEQTFNMIISDDFLVPYAGYKKQLVLGGVNGNGRGIYASNRLGKMVVVIDNAAYTIDASLNNVLIGNLNTNEGDVFIDENEKQQIAICDKKDIWIYDYSVVPETFTKAYTDNSTTPDVTNPLDFVPGYITYQNGYFIASALGQSEWRLNDLTNTGNFPDLINGTSFKGGFQSKGDTTLACVRVPGKGSLLYVFGHIVTENWYDIGAQLFPYQKSSYVNSDFGCLNQATIATNDNIMVWLAGNEKSGPSIMVSLGGEAQRISNDGIDFKLASLSNPQDSFGFLFRQDGHVIYQLCFPTDDLSYIYDFNIQRFFTVTDENMNHHIARRVAFFNNTYYFVSDRDGDLYEMNSKYTNYDYSIGTASNIKEIPRVRVCKNLRLPDQSRFVINNMTMTIEQGADESIQRVDLSVSKDGGVTFSSYESHELNTLGNRKNRLNFWGLGMANDFVPQFRFFSKDRFVVGNGVTSIYQ